jgi:hypothetical protein
MPLFAVGFLHHEGYEEHEGVQNETLDAILDPRDIEIDQQSGLDASQLHVGQPLRLVKASDLLDTLQRQDQRILCQDVDAATAVQANPLVAGQVAGAVGGTRCR